MQNTAPDPGLVHVAVGVIKNANQQILIAQRPEDKAHGGCWEFPGGKIKAGESMESALQRELLEELNLVSTHSRPLITIDHEYADYRVRLHVSLVYDWHGNIQGREGQVFRWIDVCDLSRYHYPEANRHIIKAISLPEIYLVTSDAEINRSGFLEQCEKIVADGCRLLQFRYKSQPFEEIASVFQDVFRLCNKYGAKVLLNSTVEAAIAAGAHGCHLSSAHLLQHSPGRLPDNFLIGASCHDAQQLEVAEKIDADFAVIGPVKPTSTHPDANGIGWDGMKSLVARTNLPVYAIGGMNIEDLDTCWDHGAQGIAAIRGLWNRSSGFSGEPGLSEKLISA